MSDPGASTRSGRTVVLLLVLGALLLIFAAVRVLLVGGWPGGEYGTFVLQDRALRVAIAVIVGVALASSGVSLQALLRNPLAEPYVLGLSTGAGVGIFAQAWLGQESGLGGWAFAANWPVGALLGALVSMAIVLAASRRHGLIDPVGLLLTGVVLSTVNGALIMLCNLLSGPGGMRADLARWMMGSLGYLGDHTMLIATASVTAVGLGLLLMQSRAMDIATLSDDEAISLGVDLPRLRLILFATAGVLAAAGVVLAGPIAFVGLIAPHVARSLLGPAHGPLLVGAALVGATLLILGDAVSGQLADSFQQFGRLPIGIFTAMIGGPAFLWMLRPQLGRAWN